MFETKGILFLVSGDLNFELVNCYYTILRLSTACMSVYLKSLRLNKHETTYVSIFYISTDHKFPYRKQALFMELEGTVAVDIYPDQKGCR